MFWILAFFFMNDNTVFHNGVIHTLDPENATARVLITRGDRIAFVGQEIPDDVDREGSFSNKVSYEISS